ncbi:probable leucine-rich repeat receptor-like protein kinase at5g63930 [Phtheirospermum japonicum]|uniref:non-specific serine/threonine protein kinase n=1 Tax=Phtheirospermum japonicum TaxID=374723 RepID=A0A830B8F3_9LAMI|nr:probable leucine-rich repeat receptor-like protein kinase at5g63930 [Phtheirospermum japonicum]
MARIYDIFQNSTGTSFVWNNVAKESNPCSWKGEIPVEIITRYTNLSLIDLSVNQLTGPIPEEFGGLTKLQTLVLSINNLTGEIPMSISEITTLVRFAANQNNFNGPIPSGITSYLGFLDLSFNKLTGMIPDDLLARRNLQYVDLSYNELTGPIPTNISDRLFRLRLGSNSLNGSIPAGPFGNLANLMYLELDNNSFTGPIPFELGNCRRLALLNLAQNGFSGRLPRILGNLTNLQVLNLQMNDFVGEIPIEITSLIKLQKLNISWNHLNGLLPSSISSLANLTNLDLQGNNLSGPIPDSIGSLSNLIELELGRNRLSGPIPAMPSKLQIALNLSHNLFNGPIPATLSRLTGLEVLDLSNNGFSGPVPDFLTGLDTLTHLVLTNNNLSGVIPSFKDYVLLETNGNNLVQPTPNPPSATRGKRNLVNSDVIVAVSCAVVAVGLLVMLAMFVSRRYNRVDDETLHSEEETLTPQVIHGNLLTPNSIHRSHIDFGQAMKLVTDNANIASKTRFSTYYKAIMPTGANYFVKKLNWSDKILQLGSHERFGRELQVLGKLCNSNVMIPLAYVLTVDSAYLFYEFAPEGTLFEALHHETEGSKLDWASRYSVAIGVSQGLAFLHDCNAGPILLLDLSSKSVMLKSLNEPQVGDIELCKVIDPSKSIGSLSTVAGSVGYVPPEYAYTMRVTAAGNVYSFGVVLLELLTGKPAVSKGTELAKWVLSNSTEQNEWDKILDFSVSKASAAVRSQMLAVLKVALACVDVSPETRPKMKSVLRMLLNAR